MIKVGILSPDLDRQIEILKHFPEVLQKHYVPAFKRNVKAMEGRIRPNIPTLSGRAQETFGSKVTGKGINITGRVGWYDKNDPWYPNIIEHGAKPHSLVKGSTVRTKKGARAFADSNRVQTRVPVFIQSAGGWRMMGDHPGFSAFKFMAAGYSAMKPAINAEMARANEAVVNDLALR